MGRLHLGISERQREPAIGAPPARQHDEDADRARRPLRDCLILDISDDGVRLYVGGLNVPDQFALLVGEDAVTERTYQVIWRRDREIGAKLVGPSTALSSL